MRGGKIVAAIVCAVAVLATSCSPPPDASGGGGDGIVKYAATAKPSHLNPLATFLAGDTTVLTLLQDTLFVADQNGKYQPRLAEKWDVSDDATTYTFHLRKGQKWSDGTPFTAKDVAFSLNLYANPKVASPQSTRLAGIKGYAEYQSGAATSLAGVRADGDDTVVVELSTPDAGFLSLIGAAMYLFILPEKVFATKDPTSVMSDKWWFEQKPGMGPFTLQELKPDQHVIVKRNPNFRSPVKFDQLYLNFVTPEVAAGQLGTKEADIAPVVPVESQSVEAMDGVRIEKRESPGFVRFAVNMRQPYLADVRVRQAMLYALDRKGMIKAALNDFGTVQNSVFMTDWALPDGLNDYAQDVDKARELLTQAGWDTNRELVIPYDPNQSDRVAMLNIAGENLKAVGIKTRLLPDPKIDSLKAGSWDIYLFGGGVYPIDPATLSPILTCAQVYPKGGNIPGFCDQRLDQLMAEGASTTDRETRAKSYQEAAKIENEQVPYLWIVRTQTLAGVSDRVRGYVPWGDITMSFIDVDKWTVS